MLPPPLRPLEEGRALPAELDDLLEGLKLGLLLLELLPLLWLDLDRLRLGEEYDLDRELGEVDDLRLGCGDTLFGCFDG